MLVAFRCGLSLAAADLARIDADVDNGWNRMMREYYWEPTSLIYSCYPKDVQKADFYRDGFKIWEKHGDYGYGLEDCAITGGVALSGLCDKYLVTGDGTLAGDARKIARGLVNLATLPTEKVKRELEGWMPNCASGDRLVALAPHQPFTFNLNLSIFDFVFALEVWYTCACFLNG